MMCVWQLLGEIVAEGREVCLVDVAHVLEDTGVVVVKNFVAEWVDLPGEHFDGVDVEVLQGQL